MNVKLTGDAVTVPTNRQLQLVPFSAPSIGKQTNRAIIFDKSAK